MKLNPKVYNQLKGEPFKTQKVNGALVEFYFMDDTPFMYQFAGKGRFAIWTSNGTNYRVLVEKTYYETLESFYDEPINSIWVRFLDRVGKISRKINMSFIIPIILFYIVVAILATVYFQDFMLTILLVLIVLVVISNTIQGYVVNKKVKAENQKAQAEIRVILGDEGFNEMVENQEKHYKAYFQIEDENISDEQTTIETEDHMDDDNKVAEDKEEE